MELVVVVGSSTEIKNKKVFPMLFLYETNHLIAINQENIPCTSLIWFLYIDSNPEPGNDIAMILSVIYVKSRLNPSSLNLLFWPETISFIMSIFWATLYKILFIIMSWINTEIFRF